MVADTTLVVDGKQIFSRSVATSVNVLFSKELG